MILQTIICDNCETKYTEKFEGQGFPNWGHVSGKMMLEVVDGQKNVRDKAHLCPKCLDDIFKSMKGMHEKEGD